MTEPNILALQRLAGNAAVSQALATTLQRNGGAPGAVGAPAALGATPVVVATTLKSKITTAVAGATVTLATLKPDIEAAPQSERDEVWKDDALMTKLDTKLGREDYLTAVTLLREFQPSTGDLPEGGKSHTKASDADALIRKQLSAYVGDAVKAGRQIEGMVAVVGDADWDRAGAAWYTKRVWQDGKKDDINGFVDGTGRVWIHHDRGNAGTMIHEACHKYAKDSILNLSQPLNEGITEFFTRKVYATLKPKVERGNYESNYDAAKVLVDLVGEATVASAYFDGKVDDLKKAVNDKKKDWDAFVTKSAAGEWTAAKDALKNDVVKKDAVK